MVAEMVGMEVCILVLAVLAGIPVTVAMVEIKLPVVGQQMAVQELVEVAQVVEQIEHTVAEHMEPTVVAELEFTAKALTEQQAVKGVRGDLMELPGT
jgi:hypothetical protein